MKTKQITQLLSNEQLVEALNQMREDEESGLIRSSGYVRELANKFKEYVKIGSISEWLKIAEDSIYKEAADRFVKLISK